VRAFNEPEHASRYAGISDDEVFARAQTDRHTVVTDNVADFGRTRRDWDSRGKAHHGLLYALNPSFNLHRGERVIGQMATFLLPFHHGAEYQGR
jgi:hypothetical protein